MAEPRLAKTDHFVFVGHLTTKLKEAYLYDIDSLHFPETTCAIKESFLWRIEVPWGAIPLKGKWESGSVTCPSRTKHCRSKPK